MSKLKRFITLSMVLLFVFAGIVAAAVTPSDTQIDLQQDITINFPGVEQVTVRAWINGAWVNFDEQHDHSAIITLPVHTGPVQIQAIKGGMTYSFPSADWYDGMTLDVPITTITVSGISSAANIGISQGDWVYRQSPATTGVPNVFYVFDNERPYRVAVGRTGFHNVVFDNILAGGSVNLSPLFYNIEIPQGVSNVRIANANWVDNTVWQSVWTTDGQQPSHVDVITLFRNEGNARLLFDYDGQTHDIRYFPLNGTNPFHDITIVRFDNMTDVTLEINRGDGWQTEGPFDHLAILPNLPVGTQVRGVVTSPARFVSQTMTTSAGFEQIVLPVGEVTVRGIMIPGLDIRVQHANNATHTNGALLHHAQNNQDSDFRFFTWDNAGADQMFCVQLNGLGFQGPRFWFAGFDIDLSDYFYEVFIPANVTGVTVRNANGMIVNGISNQDAGSFWLINSGNAGTLTFTFDGIEYTIDILFDGNCPFGNMTIVRFDGMTGVTLQTNTGAFNAWDPVPGTHDNYAVLLGLIPDTRIRGFITVPARIDSLEVRSTNAFDVLHLPVSEIEVLGIAIPGLNVDVRRSNDALLTSGTLLHRGPHTGGDIRFPTFTTALGADQLFMVQVGGNLGFSTIQRFFDEYSIDLSDYFYEIEVPPGLSNVVIRNAANAALHGRTDFAGGDTIMLMQTEQPVDVIFTFEGVQYRVSAYLDGTNPFDHIVILRFPGAIGITDINTQMVGHGWTYRSGLDVDNHFVFMNTKWITPQNTDLLFIQLRTPGLGFSMHHPTGGVPSFTVIDIPVTTITVVNDLGCDVHVSSQQTGAPGQGVASRNGIWITGINTEVDFWVFDYGLHWVRAGAPVNNHPFVTIDEIAPGSRVYLSEFFLCEICDLCRYCDDHCVQSEFTVTFIREIGAEGVYAEQTTTALIESDSPILPEYIPNYSARTGFHFIGWYKQIDTYPFWVAYHPADHTVTADATFRARFGPLFHPVTFVVEEGGAATSPRVIGIRDGMAIGEIHLAPSTEALPGWQFVGWAPENPLGIYPNGAMTFTAIFEEIAPPPPPLSVVFDNDSLAILEDDSGTIDVNVIGIGNLNPLSNYRLEITRMFDGRSEREFITVSEMTTLAFCSGVLRITVGIVPYANQGSIVLASDVWTRTA